MQQTDTANGPSDRMQQLQRMLLKTPDDTFLIYGIGMEHKKANSPELAIESFDRVIQLDPGYCYAYYQRGQVFEASGDEENARLAYREGVVAATKKGDAHAKSELEAALDLLG